MGRKRSFRLGLVAVASGALVGGWAGAPLSAHAFTTTTIHHGGCHNLDPVTTQNAITAVRADDRPWSQIDTVDVNPSTSGEIWFTIHVCSTTSLPTFPIASGNGAGDTGVQYNVCFRDDNSPMMKDNNGTQVGTDPVTGALYDGPFPGDDGWRACAWVAFNAGATGNQESYGVATFDQIGQYNFFDQSQLSGITAPTVTGGGGTEIWIKFHFPYVWHVTEGDGLGNNVTINEPWIAAGDTISAITASSQVSATVGLPSPVCVPPSDVNPLNNPTPLIAKCSIAGPIQGLVGLLTTVDWAPGYEYCDPLTSVGGHNFADPTKCHKIGDLGDALTDGNDLGLAPVDWPVGALRSPVDHFDPVGTVDVANTLPCAPPAPGCSLTGYQFVYGREFPGILPVPVDGNLYSGTSQYLDGGDSVTA